MCVCVCVWLEKLVWCGGGRWIWVCEVVGRGKVVGSVVVLVVMVAIESSLGRKGKCMLSLWGVED